MCIMLQVYFKKYQEKYIKKGRCKGWSQNRVKIVYRKDVFLPPPSPLSLQINFHPRTFMMITNRKHANIIMEKLPSTLT